MSIGTRLFTWRHGKQVGKDAQGNVYYTEKSPPAGRRPKRWVVYAGEAEASRVPPEWHAWLHYMTEQPLPKLDRSYVREHMPNLTGTLQAYLPKGHDLRGGQRQQSSADYESWRP